MHLTNIPFETIAWESVEKERHDGETGVAYWRVKHAGDIRVRIVEYSANYKADHWCEKGHLVYCLDGEMITELKNGRRIEMRKGMSYHVEDGNYPHRSVSKNGATLLIID